ncbi:hypothetical protein PYCC9005_000291 [Savitreella phatthalungensis]
MIDPYKLEAGPTDGIPRIADQLHKEPNRVVSSLCFEVKCCCCSNGSESHCKSYAHNSAAMLQLECELKTAARLGQEILERHDNYVKEADLLRSRMAAELRQQRTAAWKLNEMETKNRLLEEQNAQAIVENLSLLRRLHELNGCLISADTRNQELQASLSTAEEAVAALSDHAVKAHELEVRIWRLQQDSDEVMAKNVTLQQVTRAAASERHKARQTIRALEAELRALRQQQLGPTTHFLVPNKTSLDVLATPGATTVSLSTSRHAALDSSVNSGELRQNSTVAESPTSDIKVERIHFLKGGSKILKSSERAVVTSDEQISILESPSESRYHSGRRISRRNGDFSQAVIDDRKTRLKRCSSKHSILTPTNDAHQRIGLASPPSTLPHLRRHSESFSPFVRVAETDERLSHDEVISKSVCDRPEAHNLTPTATLRRTYCAQSPCELRAALDCSKRISASLSSGQCAFLTPPRSSLRPELINIGPYQNQGFSRSHESVLVPVVSDHVAESCDQAESPEKSRFGTQITSTCRVQYSKTAASGAGVHLTAALAMTRPAGASSIFSAAQTASASYDMLLHHATINGRRCCRKICQPALLNQGSSFVDTPANLPATTSAAAARYVGWSRCRAASRTIEGDRSQYTPNDAFTRTCGGQTSREETYGVKLSGWTGPSPKLDREAQNRLLSCVQTQLVRNSSALPTQLGDIDKEALTAALKEGI